MKKNFYKLVKLVCVSAILLACVSCADGPKPDTQPTYEDSIVGTWFWNYGCNPDYFVNDCIIFKDNGTVYISHEDPEYCEYDTGTYSIIEDEEHGSVLDVNITWYKYIEGDSVEYSTDVSDNFDLHLYYSISTLNEDKFIFHRFKRDFSSMGGPTFEFDPPVLQDFTRVKNGTKEYLIGTWKFNRRGTPDADWEETWTFKSDGTMEDFWHEGTDSTFYKGEYQVITQDNKSVLYQKFTQESADGTTYTNLPQPMEFWYDYLIDDEYVINVNCTKDKIGGEEHVQNPPIVNFYCRDLEIEEVTYHWTIYTFKDYFPKGTDYKLLDLGNMLLFKEVPNNLLKQKLLGWEQKDPSKKEYWAKWALKCNKNLYDPEQGRYNHEFTLPVRVLAEDMELPAKGDKFKISLSGKASEDLDFFWGLRIADSSEGADGWLVIGEDWHTITSNEKAFEDIFEIEIKKNVPASDINEINFNLCYNPDEFDKPITIEDFSFTVEKITE